MFLKLLIILAYLYIKTHKSEKRNIKEAIQRLEAIYEVCEDPQIVALYNTILDNDYIDILQVELIRNNWFYHVKGLDLSHFTEEEKKTLIYKKDKDLASETVITKESMPRPRPSVQPIQTTINALKEAGKKVTVMAVYNYLDSIDKHLGKQTIKNNWKFVNK